MLAALLGFTAAAALLTVTPGLDTALVVRTATAKGARAGAAAAVGIAGGLLVWGVGAAVGLAALLSASALAFRLLKWAGAAYLVFLGLRMLLRPQGALRAGNAAAPGGGVVDLPSHRAFHQPAQPQGRRLLRLLPAALHPGGRERRRLLDPAGEHPCDAGIALVRPADRHDRAAVAAPVARRAFVRWLDRVTGCVFAGLGLRLAFLDVR